MVMASQSGVRVRKDLLGALVQHRRNETSIPDTHPGKRGPKIEQSRRIVDLVTSIHVKEIVIMHPLAMDHVLTTLTDRIVLVKVSLAIFDISLHSSTHQLT